MFTLNVIYIKRSFRVTNLMLDVTQDVPALISIIKTQHDIKFRNDVSVINRIKNQFGTRILVVLQLIQNLGLVGICILTLTDTVE